MRVLVLFDLPMESSEEVREYAAFRKSLLSDGFMMLQKSVYIKLVLNATAGQVAMQAVRSSAPKKGIVQMIMITEKQFLKMEYVTGKKISHLLDTTERLTII